MSKSSSEQVIEDLRKSLAWLDLALATLNEGVIVLDGDMKVLFANDALAAMLGRPRILLLGASVWDIVHLYNEDRTLSKAEYIEARQKNAVESLLGTYQLRTESQAVSIELSAAHIANTLHTVLVIRDVTERLQAQAQRVRIAQEQAAREAAEVSEQRMLVQYKVASVLAESLDQDSAITEILTIVCKSLGWRAGIVWVFDDTTTRLRLASSWTDDALQLHHFIEESQKKTFLKGEGLPGKVWEKLESVWNDDVSQAENFPCKSVADKSGLHGAFAVPLQSGKEFVGVMEFFSDRIQKLDAELLTSMTTVGIQIAEYMRRRSIEEASIALREQKAYLLELNKAKDEFISLASHQLRTPATGVKQYVGMLVEGYGGELTETQKRLAARAYESNERQITIVNDLLKVAQVDAGKVVLKKEKVNLESLMHSILEEQKARFTERRQKVACTNMAGKLQVPVDIKHFRMALENVIDNASKYTKPGKNITVTLSSDELSAIILVQDEGVGIAKGDIGKIFNKFTRIDNPLSMLVGGSGLGLYWCKRIIELHEGIISVKSKVGKGTRFTISVPLR